MARDPFKPTDELRAKVRQLSAMGLPQDDIARLIECSPKTLRKHFRRELNLGNAEVNAMVAGFLFQSAKTGNVAAQIFWLKTRARWKEIPPPKTLEYTQASSPDTDQKIIEHMKQRLQRQIKGEDNDQEN